MTLLNLVAFADELEKLAGIPRGLAALNVTKGPSTPAKSFARARLNAHAYGSDPNLRKIVDRTTPGVAFGDRPPAGSSIANKLGKTHRDMSRKILETTPSAKMHTPPPPPTKTQRELSLDRGRALTGWRPRPFHKRLWTGIKSAWEGSK